MQGLGWYRISLSSDFLFHRLSCMLTSQTILTSFHALGLDMHLVCWSLLCLIWLTIYLFVTHDSLKSFPRTVFPAVYWRWIVTLSSASCVSSSTGLTALWKLAPFTPAAVHCNQTDQLKIYEKMFNQLTEFTTSYLFSSYPYPPFFITSYLLSPPSPGQISYRKWPQLSLSLSSPPPTPLEDQRRRSAAFYLNYLFNGNILS